jgi:hypothetical protein
MNANVVVELTENIEKLCALEESIINGDHLESIQLKSKQALLISEVIQSLQKVKNTLNTKS